MSDAPVRPAYIADEVAPVPASLFRFASEAQRAFMADMRPRVLWFSTLPTMREHAQFMGLLAARKRKKDQ